jgi:hypothetical protein
MNGNMAVKLKLSMFETTPASNVTVILIMDSYMAVKLNCPFLK